MFSYFADPSVPHEWNVFLTFFDIHFKVTSAFSSLTLSSHLSTFLGQKINDRQRQKGILVSFPSKINHFVSACIVVNFSK